MVRSSHTLAFALSSAAVLATDWKGMRKQVSALFSGAKDELHPVGGGALVAKRSRRTRASAGVERRFVTFTRTQFRKLSPSVGQSKAARQSFTVGSGVAQSVKS